MEDLELKKQAIKIIIQGAKEVGIELRENNFDYDFNEKFYVTWEKELKISVLVQSPKECLNFLFDWQYDKKGEKYWRSVYDSLSLKLSEPIKKQKHNSQLEQIEPKHYELKVTNDKGESIECDFFDIFEALHLPNRLSHALKYFRTKGDNDKKINDLEKARFCIKREIDRLKQI